MDTVEITRDALEKMIAYIHKTQPPCTMGEALGLLSTLEAARKKGDSDGGNMDS